MMEKGERTERKMKVRTKRNPEFVISQSCRALAASFGLHQQWYEDPIHEDLHTIRISPFAADSVAITSSCPGKEYV